jgi:hypothetical protein
VHWYGIVGLSLVGIIALVVSCIAGVVMWLIHVKPYCPACGSRKNTYRLGVMMADSMCDVHGDISELNLSPKHHAS